MKKLIALILILVITSFIVVSKRPLSAEIAIENSRNPKNEKWEYIKQEIADGKIDLKLDYSQKYQEPILLDIKNATAKDSLAVVAFMKNLKELFPLKKVVYFSDFVGKNLESYKRNGKPSKPIKQSFDVVMSYTIQLSFDPKLQYTSAESQSYDGTNSHPFPIGALRENVWNMYYNSIQLIFGFNDELTVEKRRAFIASEFFKIYWKSYYINFVASEDSYSTMRQEQKQEVKYWENNPSITTKNIGFIKDEAFLITKLFSADFKKQFENYMYANYPWRYASFFIDKELAKQKAAAIVGFLAVLIFILGFCLFWNRKFSHPFWNYFLPILVFFASFYSLGSLYSYLVFIDFWNNTITEIVLFLVLTVFFALLISFLLFQIEKRIALRNDNFVYPLIFKVMLTILLLNLPLIIVFVIRRSEGTNVFLFLFVTIGLALGRGLLIYLNHLSDSLVKEKDVELSRLQEAKAQAEVKVLQSQINPHFLYNALNSIASLAHTDADKTEKMALSLSDLFRHSINRKGEKVSTLVDELSLVRNYLEIEQIRFGDRLKFSIDVEDDLLAVEIPMFMLQPLVENAIKHGVSKIEGQGEIVLQIVKKDNGILISVQDNGPDFPEGLVSGHGLQTVYDLLRLCYGEKAEISWQNQPKKKITIHINDIL
jgi:two-component system LytT family sensor kinase